MTVLRYTLVSDGSSDQALIPILNWLLRCNGIAHAIEAQRADLWRVRMRRKPALTDKIVLGQRFYPCDLLFVHRDAEVATLISRVREIAAAVTQARNTIESNGLTVPVVCVVPVRMSETWLLFDEQAIRTASGNPIGRVQLSMPRPQNLEAISNPKKRLHSLLRKASELRGRRLDSFPAHAYALRVTNHIQDFSPLRSLSAFEALESDVQCIIASGHLPNESR